MRILVLNGSPRPEGNTKKMIVAFEEGAKLGGHQVDVVDVCQKKIGGCMACEYCHTKGRGTCIQKDGMQEVYVLLQQADMLIIGGTSLAVYPAAGLVGYYRGNKLVLVNKTSTPRDSMADLVLQESIGELFGKITV